MKRTASLFRGHYVTGQYQPQALSPVHIRFLSPSLAAVTVSPCLSSRFWLFVITFEETQFFIERKLLSFSRQDFNVHDAPASGSQLEADGLLQGKVSWE